MPKPDLLLIEQENWYLEKPAWPIEDRPEDRLARTVALRNVFARVRETGAPLAVTGATGFLPADYSAKGCEPSDYDAILPNLPSGSIVEVGGNHLLVGPRPDGQKGLGICVADACHQVERVYSERGAQVTIVVNPALCIGKISGKGSASMSWHPLILYLGTDSVGAYGAPFDYTA